MQQLNSGTQTEPPTSGDAAAANEPDQADEAAAAICHDDSLNKKPPTTPRPATAGSGCANNNSRRPATSSAPMRVVQSPAGPSSRPQSRPRTAGSSSSKPPQEQELPPRLLSARPKTSPPRPPPPPTPPTLTDRTPMVLSHNPDPRLRSWQRLEHLRLHRLGLSSKLSRRYNVTRAVDFQPVGLRFPPVADDTRSRWLHLPPAMRPQLYTDNVNKKNDVAPFRTFQRPTCGVFFDQGADNKKIKHDLEPSDLIKWRYFV